MGYISNKLGIKSTESLIINLSHILGINLKESLRVVMGMPPWGHRPSLALMSAYGAMSPYL